MIYMKLSSDSLPSAPNTGVLISP